MQASRRVATAERGRAARVATTTSDPHAMARAVLTTWPTRLRAVGRADRNESLFVGLGHCLAEPEPVTEITREAVPANGFRGRQASGLVFDSRQR